VARFESTKATAETDSTGTIAGNLTIRGVTKPATFRGAFLGVGPDHRGGTRAGFHATATINRMDYGVSFNGALPGGRQMLGEEVELILDLELIEVVEALGKL